MVGEVTAARKIERLLYVTTCACAVPAEPPARAVVRASAIVVDRAMFIGDSEGRSVVADADGRGSARSRPCCLSAADGPARATDPFVARRPHRPVAATGLRLPIVVAVVLPPWSSRSTDRRPPASRPRRSGSRAGSAIFHVDSGSLYRAADRGAARSVEPTAISGPRTRCSRRAARITFVPARADVRSADRRRRGGRRAARHATSRRTCLGSRVMPRVRAWVNEQVRARGEDAERRRRRARHRDRRLSGRRRSRSSSSPTRGSGRGGG